MTNTPRSRRSTTAASTAVVAPPAQAAAKGKLGDLIALLNTPEGVSLEAMMAATGWQAHSVRGALSGTLKKKRGLHIISEKTEAGRIYRITPVEAA